ncbi:MAG: hypothetical protein IKN12_11010 [Selenomonadaceae bacterium]|nr:hypothetical protein [Selenomonadaceae bacterium]
MFKSWLSYHHKLTQRINFALGELKDENDVYLFGAHAYSQFLLKFGIDGERIKCVLDNDPEKQNKRLYGTKYMVRSPSETQNANAPVIILHAGVHSDEIAKQLKLINPNVKII